MLRIKKYSFRLLLLGLVLFYSSTVWAQDPNFHIYLCFGQSNMAGHGTSSDLSAQDLTVDSRYQTLRSANCFSGYGQWETAVPPLARCNNVAISPSDYFGRKMVENLPSGIKVGTIVVAVGGADIGLFHKTDYPNYVASAPNWMKNEINEYGGNPYGRLVDLAKEAQKSGVIKGILLHQGESNNNQSTWPGKVKAIYDNLINDLGLDPNQTPLLVGETVSSAQGGACGAHNNQVARMPDFIPNAHVISSAGLPCIADKLHFTLPSYRTLGERYADKMLTLISTGPTAAVSTENNVSDITLGESISFSAISSEDISTISKVEFYEGSTLIGNDNTSPYSVTWTPTTIGEKEISVKIIDKQNSTYTSSTLLITVKIPQSPYDGQPHPIPGIVQFEHFDEGGNGSAYFDDSPGSETDVSFRDDEDVDIEACTDVDGGYNIGWATAGEWLEYTVDVSATATYDLELRVACDGDGRTIDLQIGNVMINNIAIPNTGGWQNWEAIVLDDISLEAGEQIMKVTIGDVSYVNLNYLEIKGIITSEQDKKAVNIIPFPNPIKERLNLSLSTHWKLVNSKGDEVEKGHSDSILMTDYPAGMYFIILQNQTYKCIKE